MFTNISYVCVRGNCRNSTTSREFSLTSENSCFNYKNYLNRTPTIENNLTVCK